MSVILASQFQSNLHPIPDLYAKFPCFHANILLLYSNVLGTYVGGTHRLSMEHLQGEYKLNV